MKKRLDTDHGIFACGSQRHWVSDCRPFASLRASAYLVARNDSPTQVPGFAIV